MKLFAWLRALLHRPAPPSRPSYRQPPAPVQRDTYPSLPLVPIAPPTPAQRQARMQAREPAIAEAVAHLQAKESSEHLPAELYRLNIELECLRADLAEARGQGWIADELHLSLEVQQVVAKLSLRVWQHSLVEQFGPEIGGKLGRHEVEVGMRLEHMVASYGTLPLGTHKRVAEQPLHLTVQYGSEATGSYFELIEDVVTVARLGLPTLPAHVLNGLDLDK